MPRIVIFDVETTGLNPYCHQILEIGIVLFNSATCHEMLVEDMPHMLIRVKHEEIFGEPQALALNYRLIKALADSDMPNLDSDDNEYLALPEEVAAIVETFIIAHDFDLKPSAEYVTINAGGKNAASFDIPFLRALPGWDDEIRIAARVYDPTSQFMASTDKYLPNLQECAARAGLTAAEVDHTALGDARLVARILQQWFAWNTD